jgi:hypothetical protein
MDLATFQRRVETRVHEEDFVQEEDLMALKRAAGAGEAIR